MKLCWLLGVLTIALCRGDITKNKELISEKQQAEANKTTVQTEDTSGSNKTLSKRQTKLYDGSNQEESERDFKWNILKNSYWQPEEKRMKFSSLAGIRDQDESNENKRAKFSSWAGKRNEAETHPSYYTKRVKFSSWAGKRNGLIDLEEKRKPLVQLLAGFPQDSADEYDDIWIDMEKRGRFSNWGGKRDTSSENKRKFSSWSGKRNFIMNPPIADAYIDLNTLNSLLQRQNVPYMDDNETNLQNPVQINAIKTLEWNDNKNYRPDLNQIASLINDAAGNIDWLKDKADKRGKFSSWGGKRKFSSWGGKRANEIDNSQIFDDNLIVDKRAKFSSWAGKRDDSPFWKSKYQGKRGKFSSWAGKRNDNSFSKSFESEKRGKFSNWGGKRDINELDIHDEKRTKFSSWAGKRSDMDNENAYIIDKRDTDWIGLKKKIKGRGFSSWGGKRSFLYDVNNDDVNEEDDNEIITATEYNNDIAMDHFYPDKRATKFSSWAGKRSTEEEKEKRQISSEFTSWGGKRNFELVEGPAKFSSWAGKRSVNPNDGPEVEKRKENLKDGLLRRYNRFNSWRGKKDNIIPLNDTQTKLEDVNFNQSKDNSSSNKFKRAFANYFKQFEMIKRNPLLRAWIGKHYPDMMTWKRRPAFSSWGGKRSLYPEVMEELHQFDNDIKEDKRGRFSNWGGKRYHTVEKRSLETSTEQFMQNPVTNKKSVVRATNNLITKEALDQQRFYLRNSKDGLFVPAIRPIRRQFYAWGGKRAAKV